MQKWICTVCGYIYDPGKVTREWSCRWHFVRGSPGGLGMPGLRCEQGRLREDRGLSISPFDAQRISDLALEAGFSRAGFTRGVDQGFRPCLLLVLPSQRD